MTLQFPIPRRSSAASLRRFAAPAAALLALLALIAILCASPTAGAQDRDGKNPRTEIEFVTGLNDPVVGFINERVRTVWADNLIEASPLASDEEWLRRVYLDITGRIPPLDRIDPFIADKDPAKRAKLIDELLDDPAYVRNMTTVWTNLLIGRQTPQRTNRAALEKFLRDSFAQNRPWNEIVYDLLTAEGHFEENGAVNFLLAQLTGNPNSDDYAIEATARVTKLFLGMQVQCTQCHNHPFNDWKQDQFWEFNSFLRQVRRNDVRRFNPETGRNEDVYSELVERNYSGPVYFEKRSGLMQVAYPTYFGQRVDAGENVARRDEFARLVTSGADGENVLARALVNRMWGHFFGYGFTKPVDDMGPHNPPTHPEVLDRLAEEFAASGYDLKKLIRWVANTEAYNLTSRYGRDNEVDNPAAGEVPLFSHMYIKSLTAEQLYDSLIVATGAGNAGAGNFERAQQQRERWLRDFLRIFGGNEDDEPNLFSGTIPQALMMMNGDLVENAMSTEPGSLLYAVLNDPALRSDTARVRQLYLAVLCRNPTRRESSAATQLIRGSKSPVAGYQDLYWALLNSNEFILNH